MFCLVFFGVMHMPRLHWFISHHQLIQLRAVSQAPKRTLADKTEQSAELTNRCRLAVLTLLPAGATAES